MVLTDSFFMNVHGVNTNIASLNIEKIIAELEKKRVRVNRKKSAKQISGPSYTVHHIPLDEELKKGDYLSAYDLATIGKEFDIRIQPCHYTTAKGSHHLGLLCELSYHGSRQQLRRFDSVKGAILKGYASQESIVHYVQREQKKQAQLIHFSDLKKKAA